MRQFIVLAFILSSFGAFAAGEYSPAFRKPATPKTSAALQEGIQRDISRLYSLFKKDTIQIVKNTSDHQPTPLFEEEVPSE